VWFDGSGSIIRNCLITKSTDGRTHNGAGIGCHGGGGTIENCTIVGNYGQGIGAGNPSTYLVRNTISYFNTGEAMFPGGGGSGTLIASNCCATTLTYVDSGTGNITTVPSFIDYAGGNYRQAVWSAGVDHGTNIAWMGTATDLDGSPRISANGRSDMGVYETTAGPPPTYYVARSGQTPGNFLSWGAAGSNIQQVVSVAAPGATILISNGVYRLTNQVVIGDLKLRSFKNGAVDRNGTIINGNKVNRCFTLNSTSSRLEGLTISNGWVSAANGGGVNMNAGTLDNCLIIANVATNNGNGGGVYMTGSGSVVTNCDIVANKACHVGGSNAGGGGLKVLSGAKVWNSRILRNLCPIYWSAGGGVNLEGASLFNCQIISNSLFNPVAQDGWSGAGVWAVGTGNLIRNCLIARNSAGEVTHGSGIGSEGSAFTTVENCTVVGNQGRGIAGRAGYPTSYKVVNTISYFNTDIAMIPGDAGGTLVASNCCATTTSYITSGSNNFTNNPQLVNYAGGDYRLKLSSPCVDTGYKQAWMTGAVDLDGLARVDRFGFVDRGAYEAIQPPRGTSILVR
jgi:hypothetical protein